MREYQYLEFRAIDKPLDREAMRDLRAITTRAEITPTSLVNEYHFGSFKGEPVELMKQYFDAFFYFGSWGSHELMLRFPLGALDLSQVQPYCCEYTLDVHTTPTHLILEFHAEEDDSADRFEGNDDDVSLDSVIGIRNDLIAGDLRALYIAWLSAAQCDDPNSDELEPPVPGGLGNLTSTLESFAAFMRVDALLLEVAAEASEPEMYLKGTPEDYGLWLGRKSAEEKDSWLVRLLDGAGPLLRNELLQQFRVDQALARGEIIVPETTGQRTVGDLLQAQAKLAASRRRQTTGNRK
ncbi:MAG: hypothetical protein ACFCD0_20745 [Gemmataceae bacterium]